MRGRYPRTTSPRGELSGGGGYRPTVIYTTVVYVSGKAIYIHDRRVCKWKGYTHDRRVCKWKGYTHDRRVCKWKGYIHDRRVCKWKGYIGLHDRRVCKWKGYIYTTVVYVSGKAIYTTVVYVSGKAIYTTVVRVYSLRHYNAMSIWLKVKNSL